MNETQQLKREIVQSAFEKLLDEAKVPTRYHLKVIEALAERVKEHKQDMMKHEEQISQHQNILRAHEYQIQRWEELSKQLTSITHLKGDKGDSIKGDPGINAIPVDEEALVKKVMGMIRIPQDGEPGKNAEIDEDKVVEKLIKKLQKERSLDVSHIRNAQTFMKDGIKYKIEELMRGAGGTGGAGNTFVYNELVSGSGTTFTLAHTPKTGLLTVFERGQKLMPTTGYTISGAVITTVDTLSAGDVYADYQY